MLERDWAEVKVEKVSEGATLGERGPNEEGDESGHCGYFLLEGLLKGCSGSPMYGLDYPVQFGI